MTARTVAIIALMTLTTAEAGDPEPCVIPKGPPCLTLDDPRLWQGCHFETGACFALHWDEYVGSEAIEAAEIVVTPTCGKPDTAAKLERQGRDHLAAMQTLPIEVVVTTMPCVDRGFVDVKVTKFLVPDAE